MLCPPCVGQGLVIGTLSTPCPLCRGRGQLSDDRLQNPRCPACAGQGLAIGTTSTLCTVCDGWGRLPAEEAGPDETSLAVAVIDSGKPRTAHLAVAELLMKISGSVRVCDPYYGTGMLYRLDLLVACDNIRVLTQTPDRKEKPFLDKALAEFNKEHPHVEFRKVFAPDLHDRYILSSDMLLILGQGLKDIGNKQSFAINIPISLVADIAKQVADSFDALWQTATPVP